MLQQLFRGRNTTAKCPCKTAPLNKEQLKTLLMMADKDGDGRLSKEELKEAFRRLAALFPGWRAWRALHHADNNGDGYISPDELDQLVIYAQQKNYKNPGCPCNNKIKFL